MPDFDEARHTLNVAKATHTALREQLTAARAGLHRAERAAATARRSLAGDDPAHQQLADDVTAAAGVVAQAAAELADAGADLAAAVQSFGLLNDPRTELSKLSDDFPVLLFPVRLETRFRTDLKQPQLWVRIFPDTCLIDTFEPALAEVEVAGAERYWRAMWRAGGEEADERAAWRGLVEAHGSGRAGWIADNYLPANHDQRPTKAAPTDVLLVGSVAEALSPDETALAAQYWVGVWRVDAAAVAEATALLQDVFGPARARELVRLTRPYNLDEEPPAGADRATAPCAAVFVVLQPVAAKSQPWSQAPRVELLPDRFVLLAEHGADHVELLGEPIPATVLVGPDPFAAPADALRQEDGDLVAPDELRWMFDFDRAVADGLGFRVDLTPEQAADGFDRLKVLGVRLGTDERRGAEELAALLRSHHHGRSGLSLPRQGTPTNNTEGMDSGFTRGDDADLSFADRQGAPLFTPATEPMDKRDGQWLAELLGIEPRTLTDVRGAGGTDQREARAMQTALWPATFGYFLTTMMDPLVNDEDVDHARWFFTGHVLGRGVAPAVRIGAQPYGILPTTAFSQITWLDPRGTNGSPGPPPGLDLNKADFLRRLHGVLQRMSADWTVMAEQAPAVGHAGAGDDPHAELLGILGQHPSSVDFQYRYAEDLLVLYNYLVLWGLTPQLLAALNLVQPDAAALALLADLGHSGSERPAVLDKVYFRPAGTLSGPLVDDRPPSETDPVRVWAKDPDRNYLRWLADAARESLEAVRTESGFVDDTSPRALLYLLLRHALLLGYEECGRRLHRTANFDWQYIAAMRREPAFIHVSGGASESRFAPLYRTESAINQDKPVAEHIADLLATAPANPDVRPLRAQIEAVEALDQVPTARLERVLAEHVDSCAYRLDAWRLGYVGLQLELMRGASQEPGGTRGVYLGAYGWLENVRPEEHVLTPVELTDTDLVEEFTPEADPVLRRDAANGGYIHAPSLNHAVTAAVLRNGYLANATPDQPDLLAVNLSSERVRLAVDTLEGMRQGQSVGELLGYHLERGLHDRYGPIEVDRFIHLLRGEFPLVANHLSPTKVDGVPIEDIEARHVVDGLRFVDHARKTGASTYPFDLTTLPSDAGDAEKAALEAEVRHMINVYDSLGDLALAEGVHQAVQGNADRAAATITTFTTGQHPPEPDVTRTPATGTTLTHRVAMHLRPGPAGPLQNATPRAVAEPAVDDWLAGLLPPLGDIGARVRWTDPVTGQRKVLDVTLGELGVRPVDVIELLRFRDPGAMAELDDRVSLRWRTVSGARPDAVPTIEYREPGTASCSVFEVGALATRLRSVLTSARPLRPSDVALPNEVTEQADLSVTVDPTRITAVAATNDALIKAADAYITSLQGLLRRLPGTRGAVLARIDRLIAEATDLLTRAALLGFGQSTWGFAHTWRRERYADLIGLLRARTEALGMRLQRFDDLMAAYQDLPADTSQQDRFQLLRTAESVLTPAELGPLPADPAELMTALQLLRVTFAARRDALVAVHDGDHGTLAGLLAATAALLPLTDVDTEPFVLTDVQDAVVTFAGDLHTTIAGVRAEAGTRSSAAAAALAAYAGVTDPIVGVRLLREAAQALLGEDFLLVPRFTLEPEHSGEWRLALAASTGGALLAHLDTEFPVDDWFHGVARVRTPLRHLEQTIMLAGALGGTELRLDPVQLPHVPGEGWLGLDFAPGQRPDADRLLYTATYPDDLDLDAPLCGLLLDQWTEVVPGDTATTGLTFHFDRPNSEAPQAMLLVTPASMDGAWRWGELLGALEETLELAKQRAVEPEQVDKTAYARFLPATILAAARKGLSISTSLGVNNGVADMLEDMP
ncbi:hypothetical protein AB0K14_19460 [Actinosynnema sp. NPDC050801]|uniref:hypothetical protein n=1 Tax=unclassified Actinosynnema TaxID=2637065 RepID=UPI003410232D